MPFEDREARDLEAICGLLQAYLGTGIPDGKNNVGNK